MSWATAINNFAFAGGPHASRRLWLAGGAGAVVVVALAGAAAFRVHSDAAKTTVQAVPRTQNGTGFSGSNQVRRDMVQGEDAQAAQKARETGSVSLASPEASYPDSARTVRQTAANQVRTSAPTGATPLVKMVMPDESMMRGYLLAMNRAMQAMTPGTAPTVANFDERDLAKERAEERAVIQKAAASADIRGSSSAVKGSGHEGKHGLGLAGRLVSARTVLAATMQPDTGKTPALVEITSGPLAGYRMEGTIDKHEDGLTIPLDTLFYGEGKVPVKAMLIAPETKETSVACDVDHKYLLRVGVPVAVGIVQGLGQAAQLSGSSFASGPYGGAASYGQFSPLQIAGVAAGAGAQGVQSILRDALPKGSTVTLCSDVAVNVYFQDDVYLPN